MSENDVQEKQTEEIKNGETGRTESSGLGVLFREERERQGLDLKQVADITRLRHFIIEALENEEWDSLPQSVFVRGFIRTYAQALSLDEKQALELYENSGAVRMVEPKYLAEPSKSGRWRVVLTVFLLVLIGLAIFLYLAQPSFEFIQAPPKSERPSDVHIDKQTPPEKPVEKAGEEKVVPDLNAGVTEEPEPSEKNVRGTNILQAEDQPSSVAAEETESGSATSVGQEQVAPDPTGVASAAETEECVLQAAITETTWVRVYVDDEDPQEFIFQPGSNPQWKARKGFNLVIGNAAGITLDFNGKRVENLGNMGQVIRLFLPTDFRSEKYED